MSQFGETSLDRHFALQVRNLIKLLKDTNVSEKDLETSQRWLRHLKQVEPKDKYARNCMLLMINDQLEQSGKLRKPITEVENMDRCMDELLNEYKRMALGEQPPVEDEVQETNTNAVSQDGGSSRCAEEVSSVENHNVENNAVENQIVENNIVEYDSLKQANQNLLKEIDSLHSRTLETEKHYRSRSQMFEKTMAEKVKAGKPELQQEALYQACREAIVLLRNWPGDTIPLNFLANCLEPLIRNELVDVSQISELDRTLQDTLNEMVKEACMRRDKNVRILYDYVLKHQDDVLKEKEEKLNRIKESLKQERHRLRLAAEDLKRREDLVWSQAIGTLAISGNSTAAQSPRISLCELCHREKSYRSGIRDPMCQLCRVEQIQNVDELEKLSDVLSDLSIDKC
ncbi:uncharacterized protein LOC108089070 [Drosophila ficusphila]|uniref:uncharacterized protein LOC108089070 n=1 Tax=Drosophila ficusphila TaxID=30025 RepID=UPI0007E6D9D7|nr:uncharacterized protein LOC108089070 [Drosophila ficusphila]